MSDPSCIATAATEPAAAATAPGRAAASCLIRRCEGVSVSCSHAALTAPDQASWSKIILGSREIQNLTVSQSLENVSLETLCSLRTKQGPSNIPVCMACPCWGRLHITGNGECLTVQRREYTCLICVFMATFGGSARRGPYLLTPPIPASRQRRARCQAAWASAYRPAADTHAHVMRLHRCLTRVSWAGRTEAAAHSDCFEK